MGRPPSNGGPSFRFNPTEVAEMEVILEAHNTQVPAREVLVALAEKFSDSAERSGNAVQMKQVWSWFQNRRYALRAKASKAPGKLNVSMPQNDSITARIIPQAPQLLSSSTATLMNMPQATNPIPAPTATDRKASQMEFEARSARDGAWYDVASFRSQRSLEAGDLEVLVCFAGFEPDEDEWVHVRRNVRQRSLPCEPSECSAVLPGDLVLCFQEAKDQALYFDAHVLDAQRRRHDVRGCRCRFLVRYDHDQYEEIVPLKKVCRRPETDYRLQQLNAESAKVNLQRTGADIQTGNTLRVYPPVKTEQNQTKVEEGTDGGVAITTLSQANNQLKSDTDSRAGQSVMVDPHAETTQMQPIAKTHADTRTFVTPVTQTGLPVSTDSVVWPAKTSETDTACRANFSATREPNVLPLKTPPVSGANGGNNVPASIETIVSPSQTTDSGIVTDVGISNHPPSNAAAIGGTATSSVTTSSGEHISF